MPRPKNDMVLIRRIEENEDSVIIRPEIAKLKSQIGEVLAIGRGEVIDGRIVSIDCEIGEIVMFGKFSDIPCVVDGEELVLVRASEILMGGIECGQPQGTNAASVLSISSAN